ncbi:MAG: fructosamine kinase family protein [Symploca sp. SIO1C4]|uniref:Fructosamine kinase family protein n=2 Tax=Symploca sp. SIO1C4 TaxID=2607765 RepID=A0A6B3NID9_9CYAN|nr:fructosamine kinase family protein [Symploca sp. SIO1C4]
MWTEVANQISQLTGSKFEIKDRRSIGGGCINQGYVLIGNTETYFIKLNYTSSVEMFVAEALGLKQMVATQTIRVPKPICVGTVDDCAYIVLEWLELGGSNSKDSWAEMGRKLAAMHQASVATTFGWEQNNTIGSTPQINTWTSDWVEFFVEYRLGYQFKLARRRGGSFPQQNQLLAAVPKLLNHQPKPSLVHGDLWGGNAAVTTSGEPVILDPATYIGDREVDIAMTELFGGFTAAFYGGYNQIWPLDGGYKRRKTLYNLYHILNHFNLFGGGYESQANRMIEEILS